MSLAAQFSEYGTSEVLKIVDVQPPTPGSGQVRLAVRAAGVNPADWKVLQGWMSDQIPLDLPAGLGFDVAGVVDALGEGVTEFAVGDEVLGAAVTGSYAQFTLADTKALVVKPATVSWEVAGSIASAGGTALTALDRLQVTEGETVLIHAAAGGVGTFAVQLAVARGAKVIGTASERNHDRLREFGAIPVTYGEGLVERVRAVAPNGVDAVIDGHGDVSDLIELAGGPERVLTIVAFDAADTGIQLHVGAAGAEVFGNVGRTGGSGALLPELGPPLHPQAQPGLGGSAQRSGGRRPVAVRAADRELDRSRPCLHQTQGPLGVVLGSDRHEARLAQPVRVEVCLVPASRAYPHVRGTSAPRAGTPHTPGTSTPPATHPRHTGQLRASPSPRPTVKRARAGRCCRPTSDPPTSWAYARRVVAVRLWVRRVRSRAASWPGGRP